MKQVRVYLETPDYAVTRHGGGLGYEIKRIADNASVFLQGEDAAAFEEDMERAADISPTALYLTCDVFSDIMEPANDDPGDFAILDH